MMILHAMLNTSMFWYILIVFMKTFLSAYNLIIVQDELCFGDIVTTSGIFLHFKFAWGWAIYVLNKLWAHVCYKIIFKPQNCIYKTNQLCKFGVVTMLRYRLNWRWITPYPGKFYSAHKLEKTNYYPVLPLISMFHVHSVALHLL